MLAMVPSFIAPARGNPLKREWPTLGVVRTREGHSMLTHELSIETNLDDDFPFPSDRWSVLISTSSHRSHVPNVSDKEVGV